MAIDIDINTIKKMPLKMKAVVVLVAFLLIGYLYWYLFMSSALEKKSSLNVKLSEIQTKIKEQEKLASQLDKYMADVKALQENYKMALQKLPDQREIPNLFHSVASVGKEAGIEFLLFQPKAPVPKGMNASASAKPKVDAKGKKGAAAPAPEPFYEEIPVAVSMVGSFQNILYFFDKVAKLPRIINISDVTISKDSRSATQLVSSTFTIKTYMFIEKKEKMTETAPATKSEKTK